MLMSTTLSRRCLPWPLPPQDSQVCAARKQTNKQITRAHIHTARLPTLQLEPVKNFEPSEKSAAGVQSDTPSPLSSPTHDRRALSVPKNKRHGRGIKFSTAETEYLEAGIKTFGFGKWSEILKAYPFHPNRTSMSLKDKARNLKGRAK